MISRPTWEYGAPYVPVTTPTPRALAQTSDRACPVQAADLFEQGMRQSRIAEMLGVTRQAVHVWHQAWEEGGRDALLSKGPGGSSYLSAEQERELDGLLRAGAIASGFEDQRWTPARVRQVVQDRFGVMYSVAGRGSCWTVRAGRGRFPHGAPG
ncbi:transposase [Streptomyces sp. NPDC058572]|uniref:helix-turn-helix domain-containing protein n=1 Tax=Streptomyces sp. NPDC058572 TaxID=3346546 RepID=UPI00364CF409